MDPRSLEAFANKGDYVNHPKCGKCGYSLEGLPVGAVCPECGTPPKRRRSARRYGDTLTDAPTAYLRGLSLGFTLMALSGWAFVACYSIGTVFVGGGLLAGVAGAAWWLGVFIVTEPRQVTGRTEVDPLAEHRWLRVCNRVSQGAWVPAGLLQASVLAALGGGAPAGLPMGVLPVQFYAMLGCLTVGLIGLGPLSAQMSDLAEWANESTLAGRLRGIALVMVVCGGYAALAGPFIAATYKVGFLTTLNGWLYLVLCLAWLVLVAAILGFCWTLFEMSRMSLWALSNAASAAARDGRLREKYERTRRIADAQRAAGSSVALPRDVRAVESSRPCVGCGYDLVGLTAGGPCPECGRMIE